MLINEKKTNPLYPQFLQPPCSSTSDGQKLRV